MRGHAGTQASPRSAGATRPGARHDAPRDGCSMASSRLAPVQLDVPAGQVPGVLVTVDRHLDVVDSAAGLAAVARLQHCEIRRTNLFGVARSCPRAAVRTA